MNLVQAGVNYYLVAIQISGIGTLMTGINFFVTILRCKTPTMKFMQMPMFTVTTFITTLIVILAFPVFTVVLALMTFDRVFGTAFFTVADGGMPMLWANFFWVWGHPEVLYRYLACIWYLFRNYSNICS